MDVPAVTKTRTHPSESLSEMGVRLPDTEGKAARHALGVLAKAQPGRLNTIPSVLRENDGH